MHDLNGLEKWLTKGKKQSAKLFVLSGNGRAKQQGPYKKKGAVQSVRTQQHYKKKNWDWAAKMKCERFGDLQVLFSCTLQKELVFSAREVLEIDSDSDEGGMALDTMVDEDDERLWDILVAGPEQEESITSTAHTAAKPWPCRSMDLGPGAHSSAKEEGG